MHEDRQQAAAVAESRDRDVVLMSGLVDAADRVHAARMRLDARLDLGAGLDLDLVELHRATQWLDALVAGELARRGLYLGA